MRSVLRNFTGAQVLNAVCVKAFCEESSSTEFPVEAYGEDLAGVIMDGWDRCPGLSSKRFGSDGMHEMSAILVAPLSEANVCTRGRCCQLI